MRYMVIAGLMAAFACAPSIASPGSANASVQVSAKIVKPLTLSSTGSLNFGTIILNSVTANRVVSLSPTNVLNCGGGSGELFCGGPTSVPTYSVRGTNNQVVTIIKRTTSLVNATNGATLSFTPVGPATVTLTNSGANGIPFAVGGTITITATTGDGLYQGSVDVQVDYQ